MKAHRSFSEFWLFYLREHSRAATRALHYAGTALVILVAALAIATGSWWLAAALPIAGYSLPWLSHALVQRNRPATFAHPLWSLAADFRMFFLWLSGRLGGELARAGVRPDGSLEPRDAG